MIQQKLQFTFYHGKLHAIIMLEAFNNLHFCPNKE